MDYAALHQEIAVNSPAFDYAGQSRSGIAAILNAPDARWAKPQSMVPINRVLKWAAQAGRMEKIDAAQSYTNADPAIQYGVRSVCKAAIKIFGTLDTLDVGDTTNQDLFSALTSWGIFTQADTDALIALGSVPASRVEYLFGAGVTVSADDIERAGF